MAPYRVFIGLGSNLSDPLQQLRSARLHIEQSPLFHNCEASPIYRSKAVGPGTQNDYLNAVIGASTSATPLEVLDSLQAIEEKHGRERLVRWGPRTLDLDFLLAEDQSMDHPRLSLPHPRLQERNFVIQPLLDLDPDACLPDGQPLKHLAAAQCKDGLNLSNLNWKP